MKEKYEEVMLGYQQACKFLCSSKGGTSKTALDVPPTDLVALKRFIELGKPGKKQKKHVQQYQELQRLVARLSSHIRAQMLSASRAAECKAPHGVILYFEGLDCAGKSSTGKLVQEALQRAGYTVFDRRYNRPPTAAQKQEPWMNRFERPLQIIQKQQQQQQQEQLEEGTSAAQSVEGNSSRKSSKYFCQDKDHEHAAVVWVS